MGGWIQQIHTRKSVRQYQQQLNSQLTGQVMHCLQSPSLLNENQLRLRLLPGEEVHPHLSGFIGSYGKIRAPLYIAAICDGKHQSLLNLGFAVERIVLELTAMGLGTCWIGGFFDKNQLSEELELTGADTVHALIALGQTASQTWNRALKAAAGMSRRLPVERLLPKNFPLDSWLHSNPGWEHILSALRRAPSAVNRQPWRLYPDNNVIHVYSARPKLKNLTGRFTPIDIGIALCHLRLAAEDVGVNCDFFQAEEPPTTEWDYQLSARWN